MGFFSRTLRIRQISYVTGTALLGDEKHGGIYAVATGIPNIPDADLQDYSWDGHIDQEGSTTVINRDPNPEHPAARSLRLDIVLVTRNSHLAYWVFEGAGEWRRRIYGWKGHDPL